MPKRKSNDIEVEAPPFNIDEVDEVQYKQKHEETNIIGPFVKTEKKDVKNYQFKFDTIEMAQYYQRRADGISK